MASRIFRRFSEPSGVEIPPGGQVTGRRPRSSIAIRNRQVLQFAASVALGATALCGVLLWLPPDGIVSTQRLLFLGALVGGGLGGLAGILAATRDGGPE